VNNVFEAAFRRATLAGPIPYYFVIDEAQEVGSGMRLEALLAEGAKFGARAFVLAQSLSLPRRVEGFEPVVQALLANTSTQAFFSPHPEDADLVRAVLSSTVRYGATTPDLPTRQAWLRARLKGRWQTPALIEVEPLNPGEPARVQALIREVISAHPGDYASPDGWQEQAVAALVDLVPVSYRQLLSELFVPTGAKGRAGEARHPPRRRTIGGWDFETVFRRMVMIREILAVSLIVAELGLLGLGISRAGSDAAGSSRGRGIVRDRPGAFSAPDGRCRTGMKRGTVSY